MRRQVRVGLRAQLTGAVLLGALSLASAGETPTATPEAGATAIFAGGCFWCLEAHFDKVPGVLSTTSGYTGGTLANPTYEQVSAGGSGHLEAVLVRYDPARTSYARLLEAFWPNIDPLTATGQFCDIGAQNRSAIFYADAEQRRHVPQQVPRDPPVYRSRCGRDARLQELWGPSR